METDGLFAILERGKRVESEKAGRNRRETNPCLMVRGL